MSSLFFIFSSRTKSFPCDVDSRCITNADIISSALALTTVYAHSSNDHSLIINVVWSWTHTYQFAYRTSLMLSRYSWFIVVIFVSVIALRSLPTNNNITNTSYFFLSCCYHNIINTSIVFFTNRRRQILPLMLWYSVDKYLTDKIIILLLPYPHRLYKL